jgi:excisionase family DNA binding protein
LVDFELFTTTQKRPNVRRQSIAFEVAVRQNHPLPTESAPALLAAELDQAFLRLLRSRALMARHHAGEDSSDEDLLRGTGMTVREAARVLHISEERVHRLLRSGDLQGVRFGGRIGWRLQRDYVHVLAGQWEVTKLVRLVLDSVSPW